MDRVVAVAVLRLIATDVDGTIAGRTGVIRPRVVAAVAAAAAAGVHVVLVTGRPPRWISPIAEQLDVAGLAICANGALVVDLATGAIVHRHSIPTATVLDAAATLRRHLAGQGCAPIGFAVETGDRFGREPTYHSRMFLLSDAPVGTLEELTASGGVAKLLMRLDGVPADDLAAAAIALLGDAVTVTHSNSADSLLEIGPPDVTKASTLSGLAGDLGIDPADAIAFGDMPNDVPMLRWAGRGYAMADGHPAALAAADAIAPPLADDGVAHVIESLLADSRRANAG